MPLPLGHPRLRVILGLVVVVLACAVHAAPGASSSVVVSMTVPSAITIDDQCTGDPSHRLGSVQPGASVLSATGAGVCRIGFGSSNDTAMLRAYQGDRAGDAMTSLASTNIDQGGFTQQSDLYAVDQVGAVAIAAGAGSSMIRTSTDGGVTWTARTCAGCPGGIVFRGAAIARDLTTTMYLVADGGGIWTSTNSGNTWSSLASGTTQDLLGITAPSQNLVYAVGTNGTVLRRRLAGAWTTYAPCAAAVGETLAKVSAPTLNDVWIGGDQSCRSANANVAGAPTFANVTHPGYGIARISAVDANVAWAVTDNGNSAIQRTANGGVSWSGYFGVGLGEITDIAAIDGATVLAGSRRGHVVRTTNTGVTWSFLAAPGAAGVTAIAAASATSAIAAGTNDSLAYTADGVDWTNTRAGSTAHRGMMDIDAYDDQRAWAVGALGTIRATTNGGTLWSAQASGTTRALHRIDGVDDQTLWTVGDRGTILKTINGGTAWNPQVSGTTQPLFALAAYDPTLVYAGGNAGTILVSTDGGSSWTNRSPGGAITAPIRGIASVSQQVAVASTTAGQIIRSADAGVTWTVVRTGTPDLGAVDFASEKIGFIAGRDNVRYVTEDGGLTWVVRGGGANEDLDVEAVSSDVAFIGDIFGGVFATYDRGVTGSFFTAGSDLAVGLAAPDANVLWRLSNTGNIVKRIVGAGATVGQYGGANTWSGAPTSNLFGACLQGLGGTALASAWTRDVSNVSGQCQALDSDPWNAIPTAPAKIARLPAAGTGSVDVVWGVRAASNQAAGTYLATIVFEALAPDV